MAEQGSKLYNENFYDARTEGSSNSARIVLGRLFEVYRPHSVVDFGCGQGIWLAAAESLGGKVLKGFDGPWIEPDALVSDNIDFSAVDLERLEATGDRFDLAISLEVAEHLSAGAATCFVESLCRASDVVLFSAAIKMQGGTNHINEQWQSYWIRLFRDCNYDCFDIFRGALWTNQDVDWWYRQNTFLFVDTQSAELDIDQLKGMELMIPDVAHPENYERKATPIRTAWRDLREYLTGKNESDRQKEES